MKAIFLSKTILLEICLPAVKWDATAAISPPPSTANAYTMLYPRPDVFLIKEKQNTFKCWGFDFCKTWLYNKSLFISPHNGCNETDKGVLLGIMMTMLTSFA